MTEGKITSLSDHIRELEHQEKRRSGMPDIKGFLEEMKGLGVKVSTSVVVSYQLRGKGGDHG